MKKALVATFILALALGTAPSPVAADAARTATGHAYGLEASGILPIARTSEVTVTAPPDDRKERRIVLDLPVSPIAVSATVVGIAEAHRADDIQPLLTDASDNDQTQQANNNARGYGAVENLDVLGEILPVDAPEVVDTSLVSANAIEAEAVARCVNNQPQFEAGWNTLDLQVGGNPVTVVEDLVDQVIGLLGSGGALEVLNPIVTVDTPDSDTGMIVRGPTSIGVTALRIRILPGLGGAPLEEIVIAHADAAMPLDCAVEQPKPTGPGPVAPRGPVLAATGGEMGMLPLVAFGLLGGAVILRRIMVGSYRRAS